MEKHRSISRMEIEPSENGGHMVTHHMKAMPTHSAKMGIGSAYQEPEKHVFGKGEGHEMLAHIANNLGIKEMDEGQPEENEEEE